MLAPEADYLVRFYYGFLNELFHTVDISAMGEGIAELAAQKIIDEINCLLNKNNVTLELTGGGLGKEKIYFMLKCAGLLTPDDLSKYEELINSAWQWAKANYDNPYYHGKATCFIASIVIPYVGELKALRGLKAEQALNAVSKTEPYYDDFVRLSKELEGKSADEAVKVLNKEKNITYPSVKINGIPVVRIYNGNNGKIAIIGRKMPYVNKIAKGLEKLGKEVEVFDIETAFGGKGYNNFKLIDDEWRYVKSQYDDGIIPYERVKSTLWYKENQRWAKWIKEQGYDIYDIGDNPGQFINKDDRINIPDASAFYDMEKIEIFNSK